MSETQKTKKTYNIYSLEDRERMYNFLQTYRKGGRVYTKSEFNTFKATLRLKKSDVELGRALNYMYTHQESYYFRELAKKEEVSTTEPVRNTTYNTGATIRIPFDSYSIDWGSKEIVIKF